jgi:glutamate formiminotransferase
LFNQQLSNSTFAMRAAGARITLVLISVPNVSEGRDARVLDEIANAFGAGLVHRSSDPDHHRAVFTLKGEPGQLHKAVVAGAREAIARIDLTRHQGVHPRVGALDVAPIVYLEDNQRGAACAEALVLADEIGRLGVPVAGEAQAGLRAKAAASDRGRDARRRAAAADRVQRRDRRAARHREGDRETHPRRARRAGAWAPTVSTNIEDHTRTTAADVVRAVRAHATVTGAELVAPAPRAALRDFPEDVPLRGPKPLEDHLLS